VVSVLDSGAEGSGFKSQPRRCRVTVLGKLFAAIVHLFTKQHGVYSRSAVGIGIPMGMGMVWVWGSHGYGYGVGMGIPMGMGMVWVWG